MRESAKRIPRRTLLVVLLLSLAALVLIEMLRPASFLRSLWSGDAAVERTPAQSVRETFEGRRPRRPSPPQQG